MAPILNHDRLPSMVEATIDQRSLTRRQLLNRLRNKKVFAIGFNKSGTTSMHRLFEQLGRPSYHGEAWRSLEDRTLLRRYDCFSDDVPEDLRALYRRFPRAKYILQVRDLESWVLSRLAHIRHLRHGADSHTTETWDETEFAVTAWVTWRNQYHLEALEHFEQRPGELLLVNFVRDPGAATAICNFLGYPGEFERPVRNVTEPVESPEDHTQLLATVLETLAIPVEEAANDIYCPSLVNDAGLLRFPVDSKEWVSP